MSFNNAPELLPVLAGRHPSFISSILEWEKWRAVYAGGTYFRDLYLKEYTSREKPEDFLFRKSITPVPSFAKGAINNIRNSIFQRMGGVSRVGGSDNYQNAVLGLKGGVDNRGSTVNYFLGHNVLTDLLVIGRTGIFVDMPDVTAVRTLADARGKRPYLYSYPAEDILNFSYGLPEDESEFRSVLLRDTTIEYDQMTFLPLGTKQRYRLMWIGEDGRVNLQFFDLKGNKIDRMGLPASDPTVLEIRRIPFIMPDIGDSLLKDAGEYQIALLNLVSNNVSYDLKSNFPFYIEARDMRAVGAHLKKTASDGTASSGGQGSQDEAISVGVTQGRYYDVNAEPPAFIAPPSEPLKASIQLQEKFEADIHKLVNLAVQTLATRASAESKNLDNAGLEAGLSYIGLVMENAERRIADYWAAYEDRNENKRKVAYIKYPDRYSLKSDLERIEEAQKMSEFAMSLTSQTARKELAIKNLVSVMGDSIPADTMQTIIEETRNADHTIGDPDIILRAHEEGLLSDEGGTIALGWPKEEAEAAQEDHADRAMRVAEAQGVGKAAGGDPAARGIPALSSNPGGAASAEKKESRDTTLKTSTRSRVRGRGK